MSAPMAFPAWHRRSRKSGPNLHGYQPMSSLPGSAIMSRSPWNLFVTKNADGSIDITGSTGDNLMPAYPSTSSAWPTRGFFQTQSGNLSITSTGHPAPPVLRWALFPVGLYLLEDH
jgi:hypothetical protein